MNKTFFLVFCAVILTMPVSFGADGFYVRPDQLDLTRVIAPPPAPGSEEEKKDEEAVLQAQAERTPEIAARAAADGEISVLRFQDVIGAPMPPERLPKTIAFFDRARQDVKKLIALAKDAWKRPRPFVGDADVRPVPEMAKAVCREKGEIGSPSEFCPEAGAGYAYPSGHSAFGAMAAILLADMVPEKRAELFARGELYGRNRVVGGVHYPSDVASGRIAAAAAVAVMLQGEAFRADLAEAKRELRGVLGLAP